MIIGRSEIIEHLKERGADEELCRRAFHDLPVLVETRDHLDILRDLGADVDALTSAEHIPGPNPDDINPEQTGPVGAPDKADG